MLPMTDARNLQGHTDEDEVEGAWAERVVELEEVHVELLRQRGRQHCRGDCQPCKAYWQRGHLCKAAVSYGSIGSIAVDLQAMFKVCRYRPDLLHALSKHVRWPQQAPPLCIAAEPRGRLYIDPLPDLPIVSSILPSQHAHGHICATKSHSQCGHATTRGLKLTGRYAPGCGTARTCNSSTGQSTVTTPMRAHSKHGPCKLETR